MPNVDVSVVIPCYNAAKFISETLESVIKQTYPVREIVVLNDGSTDNSLAVVNEFVANHPQNFIRVVTQENRGAGIARTAAIQNASYNHVITVDADDLLHPQAVEWWIAHALRNPQFVLIYGDYFIMDNSGNITGQICHNQRRSDALEGNILATFLWENLTGGVNYIQRDAVLKVGGYVMDTAIFQNDHWHDVMLNFRLLLAGYEIGYVPHPVYYYRNTPGSLSKKAEKIAIAKQQVMAELFRSDPHKMAAAFIQMRQSRAEQLRDSFLTIEARNRQIQELEASLIEQTQQIQSLSEHAESLAATVEAATLQHIELEKQIADLERKLRPKEYLRDKLRSLRNYLRRQS